MTPWPKIKDLPAEEQAPFLRWLGPQTKPVDEDAPDETCYYPWDYDRWKEGSIIFD